MRRQARNYHVAGALDLLVRMTSLTTTLLGMDSGAKPDVSRKRSACTRRELLPLPRNASQFINVLAGSLPPRGKDALGGLVDASAGALNTLSSERSCVPAATRLNRTQQATVNSLALRWLRLARHLVDDGSVAEYRLVAQGAGGLAVRLKASKVDSLAACAKVDATLFLPR